MSRTIVIICIAVVCLVSPASVAVAWDARYDATTGLLPSAATPAWARIGVDAAASIFGSSLWIHGSAGGAYFARELWAIDTGVPVTMEARTQVSGADGDKASAMGIQTKGCYETLNIYSDHLAAYEWGRGWVTFSSDFTTFRTVRLAYDGNQQAYAWVDGQLAMSWSLSGAGGQNGIWFGADPTADGTPDSYWQYVAYSKEFLPAPEPTSLVILLGGASVLSCRLFTSRRRR